LLTSTSGNFVDDLDENETIQTNSEQIIEVDNAPNETDNNIDQTTVTFQPKKFKKIQKESITSPFQNKLLSYLEQTQNDDPDKHFLLSLLPDYKKLNDTQKLEFRINTLQFFKNVQLSTNNSAAYSQPYFNQNNVYPQYSSIFPLPTQNIVQNTEWHPNNSSHVTAHSSQDSYPSSPQSLYPHHQSN